MAELYIVRQRIAKQEQSRGASQWLSGEIEKLRARVAEAEARVEAFRAKSNLLVGTNNTTLSNQQLGRGQFAIVRGARPARRCRDARQDASASCCARAAPIDASDVLNSDIIRRLSEQRAILRAQLAEQSSTLLDGHPRIKELKAQIVDIDNQIRGEAEKLVRTFENDARQAAARVDTLSADLDGLKKTAGSSNELDVQLRALGTRGEGAARSSGILSGEISRGDSARDDRKRADRGCAYHLARDRVEDAVFPEKAADDIRRGAGDAAAVVRHHRHRRNPARAAGRVVLRAPTAPPVAASHRSRCIPRSAFRFPPSAMRQSGCLKQPSHGRRIAVLGHGDRRQQSCRTDVRARAVQG